MRTLARIGAPRVRAAREAEENPEPQELPEPNLQTRVPPPLVYPLTVASAPAEPSPSPSASFLGQADVPQIGKTKTESPPDTNGAVGRDKLMVTLNNNYVIQRKSDGAALSTVSIAAFWARTGAHDPFDPHVLYDPYSNRWIVTAADDPLLGTSAILYGVSDTADPQGTWHTYAIDADATDATWADYPTVGFSRSTVAIGMNMFRTGTLNYVRGRVIVLDYASLRAGGDGHPVDVSVPGGFALQPVATESPTEKTLYVVEHVESTVGSYRFWSIDGATLTLVGGKTKTNALGPWTSPGPGNVLPQEYGRGDRHRRLPNRQRRLPRRPRLLRADDRHAAGRPSRLCAPHRGPVGRARHERRLRAGRADRRPGVRIRGTAATRTRSRRSP